MNIFLTILLIIAIGMQFGFIFMGYRFLEQVKIELDVANALLDNAKVQLVIAKGTLDEAKVQLQVGKGALEDVKVQITVIQRFVKTMEDKYGALIKAYS